MGSSRFPGKVLHPLAGQPVLWHIIHRLRKCQTLHAIAIATSTNLTDDPIIDFATETNIPVIRGPEDNVLARYVLAADDLRADVILRVTGDAPLVDPGMVDQLVSGLIDSGADYCTGEPGVPSIHEGFSPFTRRALHKLERKAGQNPVAVEHVAAYFKEHPDFVPVAYIPVHPDHQFSGARVSIDTPADLRFLEEVYRRLEVPVGEADIGAVVRLLRAHPELLEINAYVHQKRPDEISRRVLIRCDGDSTIGLGHVYRCLALADELRDRHACGITFAMIIGEPGFSLVRETGYPIELKAEGESEARWLNGLIARLGPDAMVLDIRTDLSPTNVAQWRDSGVLMTVIDDPGDRRLAADLSFYPPVPQVKEANWNGFTGTLYTGWEYVILRKEFATTHDRPRNKTPKVLVTMGGSDPAGLTLKALKALKRVKGPLHIYLVIGSGFRQRKELNALLKDTAHDFTIHENVDDMAALMAECDIAIASFGMTAYELAAVGVPALHLALTEDHARSASALEDAGMAISLGMQHQVEAGDIRQRLEALLDDPVRLNEMSRRGRDKLDGQGAKRIVSEVLHNLIHIKR